MHGLKLRLGRQDDLEALTKIYNHYVVHSHATFNSAPIASRDRLEWFAHFAERGPRRLIVAEREGIVLGCAYSDVYRDHPAFAETIETSIYVSPVSQHQGLGTSLYNRLFAELKDEPLHLAVAGIALPNEASHRLHLKMGFKDVGVFEEYAKVGGVYYSSLWMQKRL